MFEKEMEQSIFETKREDTYAEEWHQRFLDVLVYDLVMVKAIKLKASSKLEINVKIYKQAEAKRKSWADEQLDLLEYGHFATFSIYFRKYSRGEEEKSQQEIQLYKFQ